MGILCGYRVASLLVDDFFVVAFSQGHGAPARAIRPSSRHGSRRYAGCILPLLIVLLLPFADVKIYFTSRVLLVASLYYTTTAYCDTVEKYTIKIVLQHQQRKNREAGSNHNNGTIRNSLGFLGFKRF